MVIGGVFVMMMCTHSWLISTGQQGTLMWDIEYRLFLWIGIIALLGLGKKYWNKSNGMTK